MIKITLDGVSLEQTIRQTLPSQIRESGIVSDCFVFDIENKVSEAINKHLGGFIRRAAMAKIEQTKQGAIRHYDQLKSYVSNSGPDPED